MGDFNARNPNETSERDIHTMVEAAGMLGALGKGSGKGPDAIVPSLISMLAGWAIILIIDPYTLEFFYIILIAIGITLVVVNLFLKPDDAGLFIGINITVSIVFLIIGIISEVFIPFGFNFTLAIISIPLVIAQICFLKKVKPLPKARNYDPRTITLVAVVGGILECVGFWLMLGLVLNLPVIGGFQDLLIGFFYTALQLVNIDLVAFIVTIVSIVFGANYCAAVYNESIWKAPPVEKEEGVEPVDMIGQARSLQEAGMKYYKKGQFTRALDCFDQVLSLYYRCNLGTEAAAQREWIEKVKKEIGPKGEEPKRWNDPSTFFRP